MREERPNVEAIVLMLVLTPLIQALWTLHPDAWLPANQIPVYKMFKFAKDIEISMPTYFFFILRHSVTLIYIYSWGELLPKYKKIFSFWFIIQSVQFVEYFFDYNESQIFMNIGQYRLPIDLTLVKMFGLPAYLLVLKWKDRF